MSRVAAPIDRFGGLNLVDQPGNVSPGSALNLLDVVRTERGRIARRRAFGRMPKTQANVKTMAHAAMGAGWLIASHPTSLSTHTAAIGATTDVEARSAYETAYLRYGQPGAERVYCLNGTDAMARVSSAGAIDVPTVTKYDQVTSVDTAGQTGPKARAGAVWGSENRLVIGGFAYNASGFLGLETSEHHVWISEPGEPERWGTLSFLRLTPGDGDAIQAIVAWRDQVFIFKRDRFFVLYTTSVDSDGVVTFVYRAIDAGVGAIGPQAAVAGRDGVYFVGRNGLYVTRGGDPELLSRDVTPLWDHAETPFYAGGYIDWPDMADVQLEHCGERLYMSFSSTLRGDSAQDRIAVYDPVERWWSLWSPLGEGDALDATRPTCALASFRFSNNEELLYTAGGYVYAERHGDLDHDKPRGTFLGGFTDDGIPVAHRVPAFSVWGSGLVNAGLRRDFGYSEFAVPAALSSVADLWDDETWDAGTWSDGGSGVNGRLVRRAQRGRWLAFEVFGQTAGDDGWSVSRVEKHVAGVRHLTELQGA